MITWIQRLFLKHNRVLGAFVLIVILVAFVLYTGTGSITGPSVPERRALYGYDFNNPVDQQRMLLHAQISAQLQPGLQQLQGEQLAAYAQTRLFALAKAEDLGLPEANEAALKTFIQEHPAFNDPATDTFSAQRYNQMLMLFTQVYGIEERVLSQVLAEDLQLELLRTALSGPGYVLEAEARQAYEQRESTYDVTLAALDYISFTPEGLDPTEEELETYFALQAGRYEQPERVRVTAVRFSQDAFRDAVPTADEAALRAYFERNRPRYEAAHDAEAEGPLTYEGARLRVLGDWTRDQAQRLAGEAAETFAFTLYDADWTRESPEVAALIEEQGGIAVPLEPYSEDALPTDLGYNANLLASMWVVATADQYVSDPDRIPGGAVVLLLDDVLPAEASTLASVRETVLSDWRAEEKRRRFIEFGRTARERIATAVASGQSFTAAAEDAGLRIADLEPFQGLNVPNELRAGGFWQQAQPMEAGDVSAFMAGAQQGAILFLASQTLPEGGFDSAALATLREEQQTIQSLTTGWTRLTAAGADFARSQGFNPDPSEEGL